MMREYYRYAFRGIAVTALVLVAPLFLPFACIGWLKENWKNIKWPETSDDISTWDYP